MKIADIMALLEAMAPLSLQESYDNAGLIAGDPQMECSGILCCLDATEEVILEAIEKKVNLIVAHHPIVFGGLKKLNGKSYVERAIILAIKNEIALYAIHTNLDNILEGVNGRIADLLGLEKKQVLSPRPASMKKLCFYVPADHAEKLRTAVFNAGAGRIGNYSECSFNVRGEGTFKAGEGADPYVGAIGSRHTENEVRIELVFPSHLQTRVVAEMKKAHPYEEVAYDVTELANMHPGIGSGILGEFLKAIAETEFLEKLKQVFGLSVLRHTRLSGKAVRRIAVCGGAGSFLINKALAAGADAFVTADLKYHEFFDANDRLLLCDIGHYESEQFTIDLLREVLGQKFPTFAVLKTGVRTNPVHYF